MFNDPLFDVQARASVASPIVELDTQKINEAGFHGHMPCLPETRSGSARLFGVFDLVSLRVYSQFVRDSMAHKIAGAIACRAHQLLKADAHNSAPTLEWAVFYPHQPNVTGKGAYRAIPFMHNEGYRPNRKACLENTYTPNSDALYGNGYHVNFVGHLRHITRKLSIATNEGGED